MSKVMVIGLDGATFDLIKPWVAEGKLPHLGSLMRRGSHGNLLSTLQSNSAQAWSTFITGLNAGRHGIFDFIRQVPHTYGVQFVNASHRRGPSLWAQMSQAGKRLGVVNVPITYPPEQVNGFMISGCDAPGTTADFAHPPGLLKELEARVGGYVLEAGVTGFIRRGRPDLALEGMHKTIDVRLRAAQHLLSSREWDFFMVVFTEPDRAQHFFWKYINREHPNWSEAAAARFGDGIYSVYARLDEAVGRLVEMAPADTRIFIMSDHGGGASSHRTFYINRWLASRGYLAFSAKGVNHSAGRAMRAMLRRAELLLSARLPRRYKELLVRLLPGLRNRVSSTLYLEGIDWSRTRAYSRENAPTICLNVKGREPHGTVEPADYDRLIRDLTAELLELRCPETGQPIVGRVHRRDEIYSGPFVELAPDLLLEWHDYRYIQRPGFAAGGGDYIETLEGERLSSAERISRPSGIHRPEGILIAAGQGIKAGEEFGEARLMDLHPTLLYAAGVAIAPEVEGRLVEEIFTAEHLEANEVRYGAPRGTGGDDSDQRYSDEESEVIRDRLSGLGYID